MVLVAKSCNSPLTCLIWSVGMLICCMSPSKVFHALVELLSSPTIDFMPLPRALIPPMIAPPIKLAPKTDLNTDPTLPAEPFKPSSELLMRLAPLSASFPSNNALMVTVPSAIDYPSFLKFFFFVFFINDCVVRESIIFLKLTHFLFVFRRVALLWLPFTNFDNFHELGTFWKSRK